jgi:GTPase Era involved in 16S rRNA processing
MDITEIDRLRGSGRLDSCREQINNFRSIVEQVQHWKPSRTIIAQCATAIKLLDEMKEQFDRKLLITIIGSGGSGKSTLLNALVGYDELSETGTQRPTTRNLMVICQVRNDAETLVAQIGHDQVIINPNPAVQVLEHVILVDTPDIDSTESLHHNEIVKKIVRYSDVLFCVFNAENPKRKDNVDFLKQFVDLYPRESLYVVMNRCDRLKENELKNEILPDLKKHLQAGWGIQVKEEQVFCISARSNLDTPHWQEDEKPQHDFDQFGILKEKIFGSLNQANYIVDIRISRADQIVDFIKKSAGEALAGKREKLKAVLNDLTELEHAAMAELTESLKKHGAGMMTGMNAMLYQKLANQWWGPVGWLVAAWARFLALGAGFLAFLRSGNLISQLFGTLATVAQFRKYRAARLEAKSGSGITRALERYRRIMRHYWPDMAKKLISIEFDEAIQNTQNVFPDEKSFGREMSAQWELALEGAIGDAAHNISRIYLQILFNLPTLALMILFCYQSVKNFLIGNYLSTQYFVHAIISIVLIWLLSFILFQFLVRFQGGQRLLNKTFKRLLEHQEDVNADLPIDALKKEIALLIQLAPTDGWSDSKATKF